MTSKRYKFQFNGDEDSCLALITMLKDGWELENQNAFAIEEGYHWIRLVKWDAHKLPNALRQER